MNDGTAAIPLAVPTAPLIMPVGVGQPGSIVTGARASLGATPDALEVWFHPDPAAGTPRIDVRTTAAPGHATVGMAGLERMLDVEGDSVTQRAVAFHDLPVVVLEHSGPAMPTTMVRCRFGSPAADVNATPGCVAIRGDGGRIVLLSHADARVDVRRDGNDLLCTFRLPGAGHRRIAIAGGFRPGDDLDSALDAARNADGRSRARAATLRRRDRQCVRLDATDASAAGLIRSAVHRLDALPRGPRPTGPAHLLAALVAGEFGIARDRFATLPDPDPSLTAALVAWTGMPPDHSDREPPDLTGAPPPEEDAACRIVARDPFLEASVTDPLLGLAFDVLGAVPDAARGRIRLRPVLPAGWDRLEVHDLPMADARFRLRLERAPAHFDIEIEQTDGAIPARAILEPVLTARALAGASVDGRPASLTPRPAGDRIIVPVQLALDHTRHVRLFPA